MNNSKSGLVGVLSFLVLTAASLGVLGVASRSAGAAPVAPAPHGVVRLAAEPTVSFVVEADEVTVTPAPRAAKAKPASRAAVVETSSDVCYARGFGDGNGTSVRTCTPADLLGTAAY